MTKCIRFSKKTKIVFFVVIILLLSFVTLWGCKTVQAGDKDDYVSTVVVEDNVCFREIDEPYKYLFLRLYDVNYINPFYIANVLKFGINLTDVNNIDATHAAINFSLTDDFYGLTSGGEYQLARESCLDTKANKFLKKCDPNESSQITYAIKVTEDEYEKAQDMVESYAENPDVRYDAGMNFKIANFAAKRKWHTEEENQNMENMVYPKEKDKSKGDENYIETKFVCSTFVAYVLKENIGYVGDWFRNNEINYQYVMVSDLPNIPGVEKLFSSDFPEYEIAAEAFVEKYPEFEEYYWTEETLSEVEIVEG